MRTWSGKHRCWAHKGLCPEQGRGKKGALGKWDRVGAAGADTAWLVPRPSCKTAGTGLALSGCCAVLSQQGEDGRDPPQMHMSN